MNSKNYNKNNRKFIQGLRSFKDILPSKLKSLINKKGQIYSETLDNWRYFVGDDLFDISFPKSFKNENKLGSSCLTVMIKRGNEVNFEYSKNLVIDKINSFFGYEAVQNIKLISFMGVPLGYGGQFFKINVIFLRILHGACSEYFLYLVLFSRIYYC